MGRQKRTREERGRLMSALGLGFCSFVMLTSEFMPMGLLTNIAQDFGFTESHVGLMISVYAWSVALLSVPLTVLSSRVSPKKLMVALMGVFAAGQIACFLAPSFALLTLSRLIVACAHAVFWSVAPPMAVQVAGDDLRAPAIAIVATGGTIATIVGVPLGRALGLMFGWRIAFLSIGIAALLSLSYLALRFPNYLKSETFPVRKLPTLFTNRALMACCLYTLIMCTGFYCGYSFIEPVLSQVGHYHPDTITLILGIYGISGFVGARVFASYFEHHEHAFWQIATILTAVSVGIFWILTSWDLSHLVTPLMFVVIFALGAASVTFNISTQAIILDCVSQEDSAVATALYSGIYNLGVGTGGAIGSGIALGSMANVYMVAGIICAIGALFCVMICIPTIQKFAYNSRQ